MPQQQSQQSQPKTALPQAGETYRCQQCGMELEVKQECQCQQGGPRLECCGQPLEKQ